MRLRDEEPAVEQDRLSADEVAAVERRARRITGLTRSTRSKGTLLRALAALRITALGFGRANEPYFFLHERKIVYFLIIVMRTEAGKTPRRGPQGWATGTASPGSLGGSPSRKLRFRGPTSPGLVPTTVARPYPSA